MNGIARFRSSRRLSALAALGAAGALLVAGCSSDSGGAEAEEQAQDAVVGNAGTEELKIAMITHAAPGDTFWDIVQKGAEMAAKKDNVNLVYSSDPDVAEQANLIQNAINQEVDGIAVSLANPEGLRGAIADAQDAGIPVVSFNSGLSAWKDVGALAHFGQDEEVAGQAFGERLNEEGAQHAVCVIMEQGNIALEQRCAGVKDTFEGETETLYVEGTDMPAVKSSIEAKLRQDDSIDYVVTLGAPFAMTAVSAVSDAGSDAQVATFDLNNELAQAIEAGDVRFAVDQQPYLQGYMSVDTLWLYATNGNFPGGSEEPVLTGPAFVDETNIEQVAAFAANGTR
ncbi:sugar ABC transporter substrate-binding protein [Streptomyces sp. 6N223]|uniref:sugar ABC transporter substrate-binding protein n=1 Tax=Streptomyces sp. 6N223 TaxID=3457412 RepID=UPI003FD3756A